MTIPSKNHGGQDKTEELENIILFYVIVFHFRVEPVYVSAFDKQNQMPSSHDSQAHCLDHQSLKNKYPTKPPPFVVQNRLGSDLCALKAKAKANRAMSKRNVWNTYTRDNVDASRAGALAEFSSANPNLHFRNGYGVTAPNLVDNDTNLRLNGMWTNEKAKTQFFQRFYLANPDLSRGVPMPAIESELMQGDDTTRIRQCNRSTEKDYDRFVPMLPCLKQTIQDPIHIVMPFQRGGEDSRHIMREYQKHHRLCPSAP
jgi:hypothetical protein